MTAKKTHEELVELLQAGKIGFLRFVMDGENAEDGHRPDGPSGNG